MKGRLILKSGDRDGWGGMLCSLSTGEDRGAGLKWPDFSVAQKKIRIGA
jgi:hypothetical protein